jgi:hypothetical protein
MAFTTTTTTAAEEREERHVLKREVRSVASQGTGQEQQNRHDLPVAVVV